MSSAEGRTTFSSVFTFKVRLRYFSSEECCSPEAHLLLPACALLGIQIVDLVGIGLCHLVLIVGLGKVYVGVGWHDGRGDTPVVGEGIGAVVHDGGVVVVLTYIAPVRVLVEGVGVACLHILVVDGDVVVTVVTLVLVVEANGVHQFVDGCTYIDAAVGIQGDPLHPTNGSHV